MKKCFLIAILVLMMSSLYGVTSYSTPTIRVRKDGDSGCTQWTYRDENGTLWNCLREERYYSNFTTSRVKIGCLGEKVLNQSLYDDYKLVSAVDGVIPDNLVIPLIPITSTTNYSATFVGMQPAACQNLPVVSIVVSEGFDDIPYGAFQGCKNLTTITLPSSLNSISGYAFSNCSSLSSITIPQRMTSIAACAFADSGLQSIVIPSNITSIGNGAFSGCKKLKSVKISEMVTSVAADAFVSLDFDEFHVSGSPEGWDSTAFGSPSAIGTIKTFRCPSEHLDAWLSYFATALITPLKVETELSTVKVVSTLNNGGTLSFRNKQLVKGETASITATPNEGYIFLGWSSDVEGIGGSEPTLTFTVPERDEVLLIANFFPKALLTTLVNETLDATLDAKVNARIDAKIDGEKLLTAEQSAAKTAATINQKVAAGELITSDQLQVMALSEPVIEVKDGAATVGISVMKASAVDGKWENVELEEDATSVEADTVKVAVPADEKAAFYKFVVPNKQ